MIELEKLIEKQKYYRWYCSIIENNKQRKFYKNTGLAKHHIIPRSFGGTDDSVNIVVLTEREHFICHLLLVKMLKESQEKYKMIIALNMMRTNNRYFNSKLYAKYREDFKLGIKKYWSELDDETKKEIGKRRSLRIKNDPVLLEKLRNAARNQDRTNMPLGKRGNIGDNRTEKQKIAAKKHSERMIGNKPWNAGTVGLVNVWNKGKKCPNLSNSGKIEYVCPHCGKTGQGNSMKRWHFDNCKEKTM